VSVIARIKSFFGFPPPLTAEPVVEDVVAEPITPVVAMAKDGTQLAASDGGVRAHGVTALQMTKRG